MAISDVPVEVLQLERFMDVLGASDYTKIDGIVKSARDKLHGRVIWNVNSTARGGGVAEMLRSLLAYARGAGIDARWVVIDGDPGFFKVTKRIHNRLHGAEGDGGELGAAERRIYDAALRANGEELASRIESDDIVILHDPQTAGLVPLIRRTGAAVVWRCHVGLDIPNDAARDAWNFLRADIQHADAYVFSRRVFAWDELEDDKIWVIPPSIDAFSAKNQALEPHVVSAILTHTKLVAGDSDGDRTFVREDGSPGRVESEAGRAGDTPPPPDDVPIITQVSRWDRLKDPVGVIRGFATYVAPRSDAHLVMAGPAVEAVSDDPEGLEVLEECGRARDGLDLSARRRVHLVSLPMADGEENAAIVNALQRRADVVVQKSIAEGFGLTVSEAMWKARPVVASRIGGIQDQIEDGVSGVLLDDPTDLEAMGAAILKLLATPDAAREMGAQARARVRERFLPSRHLTQWFELIDSLMAG